MSQQPSADKRRSAVSFLGSFKSETRSARDACSLWKNVENRGEQNRSVKVRTCSAVSVRNQSQTGVGDSREWIGH